MAAIDIHCHIVPESCLLMEALGSDGRTFSFRIGRDDNGIMCPISNGRINRNCDPAQLWNIDLWDMVGASQIVLGTDYPFDMGNTRPIEVIATLEDLSEGERAAITGETAARLYNITP
jgi:hypothetical protein